MTEIAAKEEIKKPEEKSAEQNKNVKLYVVGLFSLMVFALIYSMFMAPSGTKLQKEIKPIAEQSLPMNFDEQVRLEQSHLNAERLKKQSNLNTVIEIDDQDWEKRERLRVLNSRICDFDIKEDAKDRVNSGDVAASSSPIVYEAGTNSAMQVPHISQPVIITEFDTEGGEPGVTIVGKAADRCNPDGQRGNTLLIPTSTVMDGVLDQDIISDYPGIWKGHLTSDVYSIDNQFILLPKGTRIEGHSLHIANVNEPIQNRMGMTVEWAILPNGKRIDFHLNTPLDQEGVAAFEGSVNYHFMAQFFSIAAYAVISAVGPRDQFNQYGMMNPTFKGQFADGYRAAMLPFIMKYLSIVPTVKLHIGMPIKIHVQEELYVKPWARVNTTIY